ncbi:MAG: hypothetical protein ACI9MC_002481 [Kiritimatiellia bacterium]|jgi:hypothetical protein
MRSVALISLSVMLASSAFAQDDAGDDEASTEPTAEETSTVEDAPAADAPAADAPVADAPVAQTPPTSSSVRGEDLSAPPPVKEADAQPAVAPTARTKPRKKSRDHEGPGIVLEVGYKAGWTGMTYAPIARNTADIPHFMHGSVGALFDNDLQLTALIDVNVNPARGKVPFVASLRFGFAEFVLGRPTERGPFTVMQGYSHTYVGLRWVHDYELGGGEWSLATADAAAVEVGYTRAAPFGKLTVISDSQFALYVFGWKHWCRAGCNKLPLTLIDQRLSVGYDPVYLDFRFRQDPVLGPDLSAGVSMRSIF